MAGHVVLVGLCSCRHQVDFGQDKTYYANASDPSRTFTPVGVSAVEIKDRDGKPMKFKRESTEETSYFRSEDGWTLECPGSGEYVLPPESGSPYEGSSYAELSGEGAAEALSALLASGS